MEVAEYRNEYKINASNELTLPVVSLMHLLTKEEIVSLVEILLVPEFQKGKYFSKIKNHWQ